MISATATDRKHARLKYVVQERGVDWTRAEIEKRAGFKLEPARPYRFTGTGDLYGWHKAADGKWFLTIYVETGRVKDMQGRQLKTALRQIAEKFPNLEFRLSANQNVILANAYGSRQGRHQCDSLGTWREDRESGQLLHAAAMACPALPTCGLALAESERMLPGLVDRIEKLCAEVGLAGRGNHHPLDRLPERLCAALHWRRLRLSARRRGVTKSGSAATWPARA